MVVLLPLAALGGIAVALVAALRRRYGGLVLLLTIGAVAAVPLTRKAGQRLFDRLSAQFGPGDVAHLGSRAAWERLSQPASMVPLGS